MLERPQSLLLLVTVLAALIGTQVPLWMEVDPQTGCGYAVNAWCREEFGPQDSSLPVSTTYYPHILVGMLLVLSAMMAAYAISQYRDRALQLQIGAVNTVMLGAAMVIVCYLVVQQCGSSWSTLVGQCELGCLLPIVALGSNLSASYCIRRDEELVRSAERIR